MEDLEKNSILERERGAFRDRQSDREERHKDRNKNSGWSSVGLFSVGTNKSSHLRSPCGHQNISQ